MAGAFTHFIISDFGKSEKEIIGKELLKLLNKHYRFLFLGSVSPDLPYLSVGGTNWADLMHYERTNGIVRIAYDLIKSTWANKTLLEEVKLAWLMGYMSHLIADATIHPIVQAIVGPYEDNKTEHRICEMTQDSLLYNEKKKSDLKYAEFSAMVQFCRESPQFDELMKFWKEILPTNYNGIEETPHPSFWFETYATAIDAVEGGSPFVALFRHAGLGTFVYRTKADIELNNPDELEKYYSQVKLPDGKVSSFLIDGYERALLNVTTAWKKVYDGLTSPIIITDVVKNWNLDTGVDMDSPNQEVTYWKAS